MTTPIEQKAKECAKEIRDTPHYPDKVTCLHHWQSIILRHFTTDEQPQDQPYKSDDELAEKCEDYIANLPLNIGRDRIVSTIVQAILEAKEPLRKEAIKWEKCYDDLFEPITFEIHRDSFGPTEEPSDCVKRIIAERDKLKQRVKELANLVWKTRWVSEAEDYQSLVGIAAEIRSENYNAIDIAIEQSLKGEQKV